MEKLTLVKFKNPFLKHDKEVEYIEYKNETLLDLRNVHFPQELEVVVTLNGEIITTDQLALTYPHANDIISIIPKIRGGSGSGKNIIKIIAGIVLIVVGALTSWTGVGSALIAVGIGLVIGGAVGLLFPTKKPIIPSMTGLDYDASQTYGWNPQTIQQQGLAIPRAYGKNKLYGNIIAANIEGINDNQYLNVLLCLGIGPYNRLSNFKLNDQSIEYFQGVGLYARLGNLNQSVIPTFSNTKSEYPLSVKITQGTPYTYLTANNSFNELEIDVSFPRGLYYANDAGGLDAYSVNVKIEIRKAGESVWRLLTSQVLTTQTTIFNGRWTVGRWLYDEWQSRTWQELEIGSSDPLAHYEGEETSFRMGTDPDSYYQILAYWKWIDTSYIQTVSQTVDYVTVSASQVAIIKRNFTTGPLAQGQYEIRVTNLTPDQTSSRYGDDMYLTAVREVFYDDFEYPRHVLVGVKALATDQLSGSLRFSCLAEGALVRVYDGSIWNVQYSNNPAWVAWDMLTQPVFDNSLNVLRYDGYNPSKLDLNKFKEWADFCDALVPDGKGGQEKRIIFNGCFDMGGNLWDAVIQVCHLGRAAPIWTGQKLTLHIDKAADPVQMFTDGNIIIDSFEETFLPQSGRASEIEIDFINSEKDYERDVATIINPNIGSAIEKANMQYFGLTKPSEAWRAGQHLLAYNEHLTRVINFSADVDAIACSLGDVVLFSHSVPMWGTGGRVVSATANAITLDKEVTIEAGKTYVVLVRISDDTRVSKTVTNAAGAYTTLNISTPYSAIPSQYDLYSFGESSIETKPVRITDIQPSQDLQFKITAIEYNSSIYNTDLGQPVLPTPNYSSLDPLPSVTDIILDELMIKGKDGAINDSINIYFNPPAASTFAHAEIWYNTGGGWVYSGISLTGIYTISNVEVSKTYQIAVVTVNSAGQKQSIQNAPKASIYTRGKLDLPSNVTNFTAKQSSQFINFNWFHIPDADLWGYEIRMGTNWESARVIKDGIQENSCSWQAELNGTYRFLVKAMDESELYSSAATFVDITLRGINENLNIILSQDEMTKASPADGTKTNLVYVSGYHALMIPHTLTDTDCGAWTDQTPDIADYKGDITLSVEYITNVIDTFKDTDTWIRIQEALDAIDTSATDQSYPDRTDQTYPEDTDQHITMPVDYQIYYSVSDDNITYSAYKQYTGTVQEHFRYVKIKINVNIASQTGRLKLLNFLLSFDVPDVNFEIKDFAVTASTGNDILFSDYAQTLYTIPTVRATLLDSIVNKVPVVSSKTATGFHIDLLDTANAKVAGTIDLQINGY